MISCCENNCREKSCVPCINDPEWKYKCPRCGDNCEASWHTIFSPPACAIRCRPCRLMGVLGDTMYIDMPTKDTVYEGWTKDIQEFLEMRAKELWRQGRLSAYLDWEN